MACVVTVVQTPTIRVISPCEPADYLRKVLQQRSASGHGSPDFVVICEDWLCGIHRFACLSLVGEIGGADLTSNEVLRELSAVARQFRCVILCGTFKEPSGITTDDKSKTFNTCVILNRDGSILGVHR